MVPDQYKYRHVCPIFKSGDPEIASNYRPVSLLSVASKILEKVVHKGLLNFFACHPEMLAHPNEQIAYRQNHICEDLQTHAINS